MKKAFIICNAHIDPVWQWDCEEGAAAAVSTFRCAAAFCREYDTFVFNHNEALLYEWVREYEPELFEEIKSLVACGRWHIMGGWYLQPDCNMVSGEGMIRQIERGRAFFRESFGAEPDCAVNFDSFGHSRGLVQILAKNGYKSYVHMRPGAGVPLPAETYRWVGYDSSSVIARRSGAYCQPLGFADAHIEASVLAQADAPAAMVLWGVGDHGGGASRTDLCKIAALAEKMLGRGVELIHATPEMYFAEYEKSGADIPEFRGDVAPWAVGCYTSQVRIKQGYRALENAYFSTEKMCSAAALCSVMQYPERQLRQASDDMLLTQFHDCLPGSSVRPVEASSLERIGHGLEILRRVRARAFFAMCSGQRAAEPDEIPILVFNPHPYTVNTLTECEFMLWDQVRDDVYMKPRLFCDGETVPVQQIKEDSTIPIEWRKRIIFSYPLPPCRVTRFDCKIERTDSRQPVREIIEDGCIVLSAGDISVRVNKSTGLIDSYKHKGREYLKKGAFALCLFRDDSDPWGMNVDGFYEKTDEFKLCSPERAKKILATDACDCRVRLTEDGEVIKRAEAVFACNDSTALVRYTVSSHGLDIFVRVTMNERMRMLKLEIPFSFDAEQLFGQDMFGRRPLRRDGAENVSQKYILLGSRGDGAAVYNRGIYASSYSGGSLYMSLLRTPSYTAHPIPGRKALPENQSVPFIDIGEREFSLSLEAGGYEELSRRAELHAQIYNETPFALSFFPSGRGVAQLPRGVAVSCGEELIVTSVAYSERKNRFVMRLFNSGVKSAEAVLRLPRGDERVTVAPLEYTDYEFDAQAR